MICASCLMLYKFFILLTFLTRTTACKKSRCTAGEFTFGSKATIECHFDDDISSERVHRFSIQQTSGTCAPLTPLSCLVNDEQNSYQCHKDKGHTFDETKISTSAILEIDQVDSKHVGNYSCQLYDKNDTDDSCNGMFKPCQLLLPTLPPALPPSPNQDHITTYLILILVGVIYIGVLLTIRYLVAIIPWLHHRLFKRSPTKDDSGVDVTPLMQNKPNDATGAPSPLTQRGRGRKFQTSN